jgi:hypothetical protein
MITEAEKLLKLSRKDFEDFEFVLQEMSRMGQMNWEELKKHYAEHPDDGLHIAYHPVDRRMLPMTRAATRRLWQIADRGMRELGAEAEKYYLPAFVEALKNTFLKACLEDPSKIDDETAHRIFQNVAKELFAQFYPATYHVPCSILYQRTPSDFAIGPVIFQLSKNFWTANEKAFQEEANSDLMVERYRELIQEYSWVGSIPIPACAPKQGEAKANEVLQGALDLFKLFAGSSASKITHANAAGLNRRASRLKTVNGELRVGFSSSSHDVGVVDEWLPGSKRTVQWLFGEKVLTKQAETFGPLLEPYQRFLDAIRWHGEAVSEPIPAAQIAKYWIAIERVVGLKMGDKVVERAAVLSLSEQSFSKHYKKLQSLYSLRSEIVHGTAARSAVRVTERADEVQEISMAVIMRYALLAGHLDWFG